MFYRFGLIMLGEGVVILLCVSVFIALLCVIASLSLKSEGRILVVCSGTLVVLFLFLVLNTLARNNSQPALQDAIRSDLDDEIFDVSYPIKYCDEL